MLTIKILSGFSFVGSVAWFIAQRDYEPAIAIVTSLSTFIAAWVREKKMKRQVYQMQIVGDKGIGVQAGGDISLGNLNVSRGKEDAE